MDYQLHKRLVEKVFKVFPIYGNVVPVSVLQKMDRLGIKTEQDLDNYINRQERNQNE